MLELVCRDCCKGFQIEDRFDLVGEIIFCPYCGRRALLDYDEGWDGEEEHPHFWLAKVEEYTPNQYVKSRVFVRHIENHLKDKEISGKVMCKICGKTIDEIYEEES